MKNLIMIATIAIFATVGCKKNDPDPVMVSDITLNKTTLALTVGESETLVATVLPVNAEDKTVVWSSTAELIATVNASGKVTAIAKGTTTITATVGNKLATCEVTINPILVSEVNINKNALMLTVGESETLVATVLPVNAEDKTVVWSSAAESIATVDVNGKIETIAEGTTIITAKVGNIQATCNVKVKDGVRVNGIIWAKYNVNEVGTFALTPESAGKFYQWNRKIAWASTGTDAVGWDSSYPSGAAWEKANDPSPAGWRVPTDMELDKLMETTKVDKEWTSVNGINGYKFTDKFTGNSIFLPASGERSSFYAGALKNVNSAGHYWSSTDHGYNTQAGVLDFWDVFAERRGMNRNEGYSLRSTAE